MRTPVLAVPRAFPINRRFESYQLSVEEICSGAFLDKKTAPVPLEQFKDEAFILLKQENDTRRRSTLLCQANGFSPRVVLELDQQMTSYNITSSGMGLSFIGDTLISCVPPHPDVVYYKLQRGEQCPGYFLLLETGPLSQPGYGGIFEGNEEGAVKVSLLAEIPLRSKKPSE